MPAIAEETFTSQDQPSAASPRAIGHGRFITRFRVPADTGASSTPNPATAEATTSPPLTVVRLPEAAVSRSTFSLLQHWEGTVATIAGDEFVATLRDLTDPSQSEEQASFPLDAVPDPDRDLLLPGAVFYWAIGYEVTVTGTRKTVSMLRFRRLPAWTKSDILSAKAEAERLLRLFDPAR